MKRRWVIRILFIVLVLQFCFGWVWSGFHYDGVKGSIGHYEFGCHAVEGTVGFSFLWDSGGRKPKGWYYDGEFWTRRVFFPADSNSGNYHYKFGFGIGRGDNDVPGNEHWCTIEIPYWFFIAVALGMLVIAWRRTRLSVHPKVAFPVEVAGKSDTRG